MWFIKRVQIDRWEADRAMKEAETLGLTSAPLKQFAINYVNTAQAMTTRWTREFRRHGHELVDWIADYLEHPDRYPGSRPGQAGRDRCARSPPHAPEDPEPFDAIMADFERVLVPGLTHWNHPALLRLLRHHRRARPASWPISCRRRSTSRRCSGAPRRPRPSSKTVTLGWLRRLIGLPDAFEGVIYDTASIATLHALAAARRSGRARRPRAKGSPGATCRRCASTVPSRRIRRSTRRSSRSDSGHDALRKIAVDDDFRMRADLLAAAIARGSRAPASCRWRWSPPSGRPSTTSIDPVPEIADICARERHLAARGRGLRRRRGDAAVARARPRRRRRGPTRSSSTRTSGCSRRSISARSTAAGWTSSAATFSLTPDYLQDAGDAAARNLMDTGIQLGRRFRALKLWMVLRSYGARGIREHLERHLQLARQFAAWVDSHADFERLAPVPFSVSSVSGGSRPAARCRTLSLMRPTSGWSMPSTGQARCFFPTRGCAAAWRFVWRSATCARRKQTCAAPGTS